MVSYATIQHHIDKGLAIAGEKAGAPFTVCRIDADASGDFPTGWSVLPPASVYRARVRDAKLETDLLSGGTLWYELNGPVANYLLGDVFVSSDGAYADGVAYGVGATSVPNADQFDGFSLAWHASVQIPIGARIDRRVRIYRAGKGTATNPDTSRSWKVDKTGRVPVILADGVCTLGDRGADGSWFPAGFGSTERPSRGPEFGGLATATPTIRAYAYVPPLPGFYFREGDEVISEDGTRFIVVQPFYQLVGVVGSQLMLDRTAAPGT